MGDLDEDLIERARLTAGAADFLLASSERARARDERLRALEAQIASLRVDPKVAAHRRWFYVVAALLAVLALGQAAWSVRDEDLRDTRQNLYASCMIRNHNTAQSHKAWQALDATEPVAVRQAIAAALAGQSYPDCNRFRH